MVFLLMIACEVRLNEDVMRQKDDKLCLGLLLSINSLPQFV